MTLTLWILGCLGFTALVFLLGAACGFVYFGRGQWTGWLDRYLPPKPLPYLNSVMKLMVQDGVMTDSQVDKIFTKLWTEDLKEAYRRQFEDIQKNMAYTGQHAAEVEETDKIRRDLNLL